MSEPIIRVRGLRKVYHTGNVDVEALRGVDLDVPPGEFVSIVGPSGSGKSTLFHIIGGLTPPSAGEVVVAGHNVSGVGDTGRTELRRRYVSFVFQKFNLLPNLSARDNIRAALYISGAAGQPIRYFVPDYSRSAGDLSPPGPQTQRVVGRRAAASGDCESAGNQTHHSAGRRTDGQS
jgi:ABC-type lipoprotein export system ATPase subunit